MGQELQPAACSRLVCVPLLITPLQLAAAPGHPLLGQGQLTLADVAEQPRLAPRRGSYPRTEQLLGPWRDRHSPLPLQAAPRRRSTTATSQTPPRVLHYGTRFSLAHQSALRPLPLDLGVASELTLVMRRDVSDQGAMVQLVDMLQQVAQQAARADLGVQGG